MHQAHRLDVLPCSGFDMARAEQHFLRQAATPDADCAEFSGVHAYSMTNTASCKESLHRAWACASNFVPPHQGVT